MAQSADAQQLAHAAAACDVDLQHVHRPCLEHAQEVRRVVAVLAGSNRHAGGRPVSQQAQAREIVGADRLLQPADRALRGEHLGQRQRLLARVRAVGVDHQLRVLADRLARRANALRVRVRVRAHLHLHARDPLRDPRGELLLKFLPRVWREASRSVDGHGLVSRSQHADERRVEQPRVQVPERHVDGRNGHRGDSGTAEIAKRVDHRRPRPRGRVRAHPAHHLRQLALDQASRREVRVGVPQPHRVAGARVHDDDRRGVPPKRAVALRLVCGDRVGLHFEAIDAYGRPRRHATPFASMLIRCREQDARLRRNATASPPRAKTGLTCPPAPRRNRAAGGPRSARRGLRA